MSGDFYLPNPNSHSGYVVHSSYDLTASPIPKPLFSPVYASDNNKQSISNAISLCFCAFDPFPMTKDVGIEMEMGEVCKSPRGPRRRDGMEWLRTAWLHHRSLSTELNPPVARKKQRGYTPSSFQNTQPLKRVIHIACYPRLAT
ncbi:hypothetical protein AG1IA_02052 [Rhizoctonia solani AG-1 IA]|uniref:Uncharacterized protein n=1 Tax=Thanatephorus cucumeris (strain AG1-IA) TaxID=983506 RepID=L8X0S7_THACA|nr:hypothetical protein AG1IA_02052 [Rhizoctonia solani AG-1 IA]